MQYRHEYKLAISAADCLALRRRLEAVASPDPYAQNGLYRIRSLYFDTPQDTALRQKLDGVDRREKYRLRLYNGDTTLIHLERKSRRNGLGAKQQVTLSASEVQALLAGDCSGLAARCEELLQAFCCRVRLQGLAPRTLVEYTRRPYIYPPGNVRVTLDGQLRTGVRCTDFLDPAAVTIPAPGPYALLEVKWDTFLPAVIRDAVQLPGCQIQAFSKYAACRAYD